MGLKQNLPTAESEEPDDDTDFDMDQLDRIETQLRDEFGDDHDSVKQMEEVRDLIDEYHNADADKNKYGMLLNINSKVSQLRSVVEQAQDSN